MSPATLAPLLAAEAERLALPLPAEPAAALAAYLALLVRFNARIRLTASSDPRVIVARHIADALVAAQVVGELCAGVPAARVVDVGAGGGLVGVPLALLSPGVQLTLVESNARKCAFLRTAIFELGLSPRATVACGRVEGLDLPRFDAALSRATWPPAEWLGRGLALVRDGGAVLLFSARDPALPPRGDATRLFARAYALADGAPRQLTLYRRTPDRSGPGSAAAK